MADVERDDAGGAVAQEDVSEASRRGADVERGSPLDRDAEDAQRMIQLESAAADERVIGDEEGDVGVHGDGRAGLVDGPAVDADLPGEDEGARPLARRRESALDEQRVEPQGLLQLVRAMTQPTIAGSWPPRRAATSAARARSAHSAASRRDSSSPKSDG